MIRLRQVGLKYKVQSVTGTSLKRQIFYAMARKNRPRIFWALREIDLDVDNRTALGVVGINGSGKTTLCSVLAGLLEPDEGTVEYTCNSPFLLTLNTGFNLDMSGRENIRLALAIRGLTRAQAGELEEEIISFAEIDEFIENPVRIYSTGMRARLAFSIATSVVPDVLLMDEILSVGDEIFIDKSRQRMAEIIEKSKALVLVSHRPDTIRQFCRDAIWLHKGRIHMQGSVDEVLGAYEGWCAARRRKKQAR